MIGVDKLIYLADDEPAIRDLIGTFLQREGYQIRLFADGDSLLAAFRQQPSDLVVLDIMMPGLDGLAVTSQLRARSAVPIMIVSARDSELDRITGITLGSDDYLTKPFSPIELVARVKAIFRRVDLDHGAGFKPVLTAGNLVIDRQTRSIRCGGRPFEVTPTEYAFLVYLAENAERALSREELLRNVWQFDFDVDSRATDDLVKRLRKKFAAAESGVLIESVWGYGFRLAAAEPSETAGSRDEIPGGKGNQP